MSNLMDSVILTTNTHPYILGLAIFTVAVFASLTLVAASITNLHYECDCEDYSPIFLTRETRPLFDGQDQDPLKDYPYGRYATRTVSAGDGQDPLKGYPYGRYVTRTVSAGRAKKQSSKRASLRPALGADWADSSYGTITAGPRVGEKRKTRGEGMGRGKRVRVEESSEHDSQW